MPSSPLAELLAPSRCLACRSRGAMPWCRRCRGYVRPLPPGCVRCAGPRGAGHPCWPADAPYATTTAVYDYRGPVAAAVVTAKLAGAHRGWDGLAALLADRVAEQPPDVDAVTWVRTADRRRRRRGVDHAMLLARAVAARLTLPLVATLRAQHRRGGPDRFRALGPLPGSNLLVVDDVLTTGATAAACGSRLLAAGAGRLHLAVLARAGSHALVSAPGPDVGVRRALGPRRSATGDC